MKKKLQLNILCTCSQITNVNSTCSITVMHQCFHYRLRMVPEEHYIRTGFLRCKRDRDDYELHISSENPKYIYKKTTATQSCLLQVSTAWFLLCFGLTERVAC